MKILYFTYGYSPHDHRFSTAINACGHEVYYMNINPSPTLEQRSLPEGVHSVSWWGNQMKRELLDFPKMIREFRRELSRIKPDIVHTGPIQSVAPIAVRSGFQPIVTMSWGSDLLRDANKNCIKKRITRYVLNNSKVLIGDCRAVLKKASSFGFPKEHTVLFPWGVNLDHFVKRKDNDMRRELGWTDEFIVLSNRLWEPIYGVENVIRALYEARKEITDLKMILLGSGSLKKRIMTLINELELMEHIHIAGRINYEDLPAFYSASDLYVSASKSDGSSVSLLEAMASSVPVLVSDIPGNREWVVHNENGWLFKSEDVNDLTNAMIHARESVSEFGTMVEKSKKIVSTNADWNKNYKKLNAAYQMALELNRSGRINDE